MNKKDIRKSMEIDKKVYLHITDWIKSLEKELKYFEMFDKVGYDARNLRHKISILRRTLSWYSIGNYYVPHMFLEEKEEINE